MTPRRWFIAAFAVAIGVSGGSLVPSRTAQAVDYVYLTVDMFGAGSGTYWTTDGQILCRSDHGVVDPRDACAGQYLPGETVAIHLDPAPGSCWNSSSYIAACNPSNGGYNLKLNTTSVVENVTFKLVTYTLTASRSGDGPGTVTSQPAGINCGGDCSISVHYGDAITLTAVPEIGGYFAGWSNACYGQGATCALTITGTTSTNAVFLAGSPPTPSPQPTSPSPTPTHKPGATATPAPHGTAAATSAPTAVASAAAGPSAPGDSTAAPSDLTATFIPGQTTSTETVQPSAAAGPTPPPATAGAATGTDTMPIVLALIVAGLFIAIAIGLVGFGLLRRPRGP